MTYKKSGEIVFTRYFEIAPSIDNGDNVMNCLCFRWAIGDESDHIVTLNLQADNTIYVGEWYGIIPFSSIRPVPHFGTPNY